MAERRSRSKSFLPKPVQEKKRSMSVDGRNSFGWRGSSKSVGDGHQETVRSSKRSRSLIKATSTPLTSGRGNNLQVGSAFSADRSRQKSPSERINSSVIRKDTRPIHDKKWVASQSMRVQELVQSVPELSHIVFKGQLKAMSVSQFIAVLNYLIEPILGSKKYLTNANYIDEMLIFVKKYFYPGIITKSALMTPNTSHSWPNALALITWLMDLGIDRDSSETTQNKIHDIQFQMFRSWNENDQTSHDEDYAECINIMLEDSEFVQYSAEEEKCHLEEIKQVQSEKCSLKNKFDAIKMEYEDFKNLKKEFHDRDNLRDNQQTNIAELQQNITELQTVRDDLERKRSEILENHKINQISYERKVQLEKENRSMKSDIDRNLEFIDHLSKELFEKRMKTAEFKKTTGDKADQFSRIKSFLVSKVTSIGTDCDELLANDEHLTQDLEKIKCIIHQGIQQRRKLRQEKEEKEINLTEVELQLSNKRQFIQNQIGACEEEIKVIKENYERDTGLLQQEMHLVLQETEKENELINRKAFLQKELEKRKKVIDEMQDSTKNYVEEWKDALAAKHKEFDERALAVRKRHDEEIAKLQEISKKQTDFLRDYEAKKKEWHDLRNSN